MKAVISIITVLVLAVTAVTVKADVLGKNRDTVVSGSKISPEYSEIVNGGIPFFADDEITKDAYVRFSELDSLGRAGTAQACLGRELLPTESRTTRMSFRPTGWRQECYDIIPEEYLYNRCHLIAFCLCADEGSPENLITGTAWLNLEQMLPIETEIARYISRTGNHVMYRVSPVYYGNDLVAYGVLVEAVSIEDRGRGIKICTMLYNVQPGIEINYSNGSSRLAEAGNCMIR